MSFKTCSGPCKQTKNLEEFPVREDSKDGRRGQCKVCYDSNRDVWIKKNQLQI